MMAAAADLPSVENLLFKLAQEFVICSICTNRIKEPKRLGCFHTFCRGCLLIKISSRARQIVCPTCSRPTPMPSKGISGLKDNRHVKQLLQETQIQEQEIAAIANGDWPICGICAVDRERRASTRCMNCNQYLCKECCTTHRQYNLGALEGHSIISLDEVQASQDSLPAGSVFQQQGGRLVAECHRHPGESAHFYCESCAEHICRDCTVINHTRPEHTYVESYDAAGRRRKTTRLKLTELRDCIDRYRRILARDEDSVKEARQKCVTIKEQIYRRVEEEIARIRNAESHLLQQIADYESSVLGEVPSEVPSNDQKDANENIKVPDKDQSEADHILQVLHQITEEARDDSFLTLYPAIRDKLRQLSEKCAKLETKPLPVSNQVQSSIHFEPIPISKDSFELGVLTQRSKLSEWHVYRRFGREGPGKGELRFAKGVAATADGCIAVADDTNRRVTVFSRDGHYQTVLTAESKRYGNLMHVPSDVAVSCTGHFIVVDRTALVKIFDRKGQFLSEFCVLDKHRSGKRRHFSRSLRDSFGKSRSRKKDVDLCCVAVDSRNQLLVGDRGRGVISVHENNGVLIQTIKLRQKPWCMAIGNNDSILVGDYISGSLEAVSSYGQLMFTIDPVLDGKRVKTAGVCADKEFIYISTHSQAPGFGAVLQYTKEGRLLGCIVRNLWNPLGMDFLPSDGSLVIADVTSVKRYRQTIPIDIRT